MIGGTPSMSPDDLNFACTVYAKRQEKIEAHKLQKWDVVKWAVTINVALASAAVLFNQGSQANAGKGLTVLAGIVAVLGMSLILYYNKGLTTARNESINVERFLADNGIKFEAITGTKHPTRVNWLYDWEELVVFALILVMSVAPVFVVWKLAL
jgi:hypothetical protein